VSDAPPTSAASAAVSCSCCEPSVARGGAIDSYAMELDPNLEQIRAVGFGLIYETVTAVPLATLAAKSNLSVAETESRLSAVEGAGRARRAQNGNLVGIAGLSLEPTPHAIEIEGRSFWTWCALDAVGIFTALGATGIVRSNPPGDLNDLQIRFTDGSTYSEAALFIADGYDGMDVIESWCSKVNFFGTSREAENWVTESGIDGDVVSISEISSAAGAIWAPVVSEYRALKGTSSG